MRGRNQYVVMEEEKSHCPCNRRAARQAEVKFTLWKCLDAVKYDANETALSLEHLCCIYIFYTCPGLLSCSEEAVLIYFFFNFGLLTVQNSIASSENKASCFLTAC